ncbi:Rnk N-terminus [Vibrio sp. B1REV9]|uniref:nucleoside diphosphate kinase regulator n=1 Tax=Vibrio TaxID=662 RepID=UPI001AFC8FC8|nr:MULTISPECIES: nucleoside diphosphate kinase regulator [Vibrio]WQE78444.1 nucleoside diphosphate kinase regulator [Vibrio alfacsensis]CAE6922288.1 Rnk N-terminus [Vibrio sp. B1REV9]
MPKSITITTVDYQHISSLLDNMPTLTEDMTQLEDEINRAEIVSPHEIKNNIVTMNSTVSFKFTDEDDVIEKILVYPHQVNSNQHISILAPIGMALLGLKIGQSIDWALPNGKRKTIQIIDVIYQPETSIP